MVWKHFDFEVRIFIPPSHLNIIPESGVRFVQRVSALQKKAKLKKICSFHKDPLASRGSLWTQLNPKKVDCGQRELGRYGSKASVGEVQVMEIEGSPVE